MKTSRSQSLFVAVSFLASSLALTSCMDIGGALFNPRSEAYSYTPEDYSAAFRMDPDSMHFIDLLSEATPEEDGTFPTIRAVYVGDLATIAEDTIILYLHGNAPSLNNFWSVIGHFANFKSPYHYGVMAYDYRGFGESEGTTKNAATMASDLDAVLKWLDDQGVRSEKLVVFANSLGSLPAGPAAAGEARIPFNKLVMEVPQSSADAIIQDATGLSLPSSLITEYNFDLADNMSNYTGDLLWMHGTADVVAPFYNAEQAMKQHAGDLFVAATYDGATHDLRYSIGPDEWERVVQDFIER